jgi:AI-2 transport protein TqsA
MALDDETQPMRETTSGGSGQGGPAVAPRTDLAILNSVTACLIIAAASWFLLDQLAGVLRPLLLAVFLCYILLPCHLFLKRWLPGMASVAVLAAAAAGSLFLLMAMLQNSAAALIEELPLLIRRAQEVGRQTWQFWVQHAPSWLVGELTDAGGATMDATGWLRDVATALINGAAVALTEAFVVGFYLLFLLLEAGRFPERVRRAFPEARAEQILKVVASINAATASYLRVKVKASFLLAAPVTIVLWAFGVEFPLMWGLLTFAANFIPYIGSIISCSLPILLSFLQLEPGFRPIAVALLLIGCHMLSAYVIEPAITGRAVGLSPLVVLIALAFWGRSWGVIGMVLAVPLTVMLKIVLENLAVTRPLARLLEEE